MQKIFIFKTGFHFRIEKIQAAPFPIQLFKQRFPRIDKMAFQKILREEDAELQDKQGNAQANDSLSNAGHSAQKFGQAHKTRLGRTF